MNKVMDHNKYPKSLRKLSDNMLRYIMKDLRHAIKVYPENPNNGYYQDEINYILSEIYRRESQRCYLIGKAQSQVQSLRNYVK